MVEMDGLRPHAPEMHPMEENLVKTGVVMTPQRPFTLKNTAFFALKFFQNGRVRPPKMVEMDGLRPPCFVYQKTVLSGGNQTRP